MPDEHVVAVDEQKPADALTAEGILAADDIKVVPVEVPEWGMTVYVKTISGTDRMRWAELLRALGDDATLPLAACSLPFTVCNADGVLLFKGEMADVQAFGAKSAKAVMKVFEAADDLNAFSGKAVEALAGN